MSADLIPEEINNPREWSLPEGIREKKCGKFRFFFLPTI